MPPTYIIIKVYTCASCILFVIVMCIYACTYVCTCTCMVYVVYVSVVGVGGKGVGAYVRTCMVA